MSKWLKIHDGIIGAFAAFCDTLAVVGFYFAREEWQLYVGWCLEYIYIVRMYLRG
jgi:hypothetical protein